MAMSSFDQKKIQNFFQSISSWREAYLNNIQFSYIAFKREDQFHLAQAILSFNTGPVATLPEFISDNVKAGRYELSQLGLGAEDFIAQLLSGSVHLSGDEMFFSQSPPGNYSVSYVEFHPAGLQNQNRINLLSIGGGSQTQYLQQPRFDWELKAAQRPFDGVQELMFEYGLGQLNGSVCSVEVFALNVAAVDLSSEVRGIKAKPAMRVAKGLSRDKCALSYRVFEQGKGVVARARVDGSNMAWTDEEHAQRGLFEIDIPLGGVLHCVAVYDGVAQHFGWLSDPATLHNSRRTVYEAFDVRLDTLRDIIGKTQGRGLEARDLESAVAWLLWMLGFSVAHLGGTRRTQEAVDLVAVAPNGNFAVIECTTGLLKAENKLPLLHDRAQTTRKALEMAGSQHLSVLPVIVTSKTRQEVRPDLEQAERLGILVLTKEDLESAISQTIVFPNADQLLEQAKARVQTAQASYENRTMPQLPLADPN